MWLFVVVAFIIVVVADMIWGWVSLCLNLLLLLFFREKLPDQQKKNKQTRDKKSKYRIK